MGGLTPEYGEKNWEILGGIRLRCMVAYGGGGEWKCGSLRSLNICVGLELGRLWSVGDGPVEGFGSELPV